MSASPFADAIKRYYKSTREQRVQIMRAYTRNMRQKAKEFQEREAQEALERERNCNVCNTVCMLPEVSVYDYPCASFFEITQGKVYADHAGSGPYHVPKKFTSFKSCCGASVQVFPLDPFCGNEFSSTECCGEAAGARLTNLRSVGLTGPQGVFANGTNLGVYIQGAYIGLTGAQGAAINAFGTAEPLFGGKTGPELRRALVVGIPNCDLEKPYKGGTNANSMTQVRTGAYVQYGSHLTYASCTYDWEDVFQTTADTTTKLTITGAATDKCCKYANGSILYPSALSGQGKNARYANLKAHGSLIATSCNETNAFAVVGYWNDWRYTCSDVAATAIFTGDGVGATAFGGLYEGGTPTGDVTHGMVKAQYRFKNQINWNPPLNDAKGFQLDQKKNYKRGLKVNAYAWGGLSHETPTNFAYTVRMSNSFDFNCNDAANVAAIVLDGAYPKGSGKGIIRMHGSSALAWDHQTKYGLVKSFGSMAFRLSQVYTKVKGMQQQLPVSQQVAGDYATNFVEYWQSHKFDTKQSSAPITADTKVVARYIDYFGYATQLNPTSADGQNCARQSPYYRFHLRIPFYVGKICDGVVGNRARASA